MWRNKKFIIGIIVAAVLLIGSLGSVAVFAADDETATQSSTTWDTLWEKVAQIYEDNTGTAIDAGELQTAVQQAQKDLRLEAMQGRLQELVDEGSITQEQADDWLNWMEAQPDIPSLGFGGCPGMGEGHMGGVGGMGGMMHGMNRLSVADNL